MGFFSPPTKLKQSLVFFHNVEFDRELLYNEINSSMLITQEE